MAAASSDGALLGTEEENCDVCAGDEEEKGPLQSCLE